MKIILKDGELNTMREFPREFTTRKQTRDIIQEIDDAGKMDEFDDYIASVCNMELDSNGEGMDSDHLDDMIAFDFADIYKEIGMPLKESKKSRCRFNENTKITLTLGQLKKLVKESRSNKYKLMDAYLEKAKEICRDIGLSDDVEPSEQWDTDYIDYYVSTKDGTEGGDIEFEKDGTWVVYIEGKKIASGKFDPID